jgi:hypothetical protein
MHVIIIVIFLSQTSIMLKEIQKYSE